LFGILMGHWYDIWYSKETNVDLVGYLYADWVANADEVFMWLFLYMGVNLVAWIRKKK
jgi:hypothetical protein